MKVACNVSRLRCQTRQHVRLPFNAEGGTPTQPHPVTVIVNSAYDPVLETAAAHEGIDRANDGGAHSDFDARDTGSEDETMLWL